MGAVYLPRIVLCVPGGFESTEEILGRVQGVEVELRASDERMRSAFVASATRELIANVPVDLDLIETHSSVAYLLSPNFDAEHAARIAHHMLRAGHSLLEAGGLAVKCDSSGIAHSSAAWSYLASEADEAVRERGSSESALERRYQFWTALFDAFVQPAIVDGDDVYSCGMHLLGAPDMIIPTWRTLDEPPLADVRTLRSFARYILAESEVRSGETYRRDSDSARFAIRHEQCEKYEEDDFYFNPYGYWRLTEVN